MIIAINPCDQHRQKNIYRRFYIFISELLPDLNMIPKPKPKPFTKEPNASNNKLDTYGKHVHN